MPDYTTKELIAAFIARDLHDGEFVVVGANLPVPRAGVLLAHLDHGPNMWIGLSATQTSLLKEPVLEPFKFNRDFRAAKWAESYMLHEEAFDSPKLMSDAFFVGGIQIDQYGNSNLIGVGKDYRRLAFRGPGAIGTTTVSTYTKRYYLYLNSHDPRVLVERCDFITSFGWGKGGADARQKAGAAGRRTEVLRHPALRVRFRRTREADAPQERPSGGDGGGRAGQDRVHADRADQGSGNRAARG